MNDVLYLFVNETYERFYGKVCRVYLDDEKFPIMQFENGDLTHLEWSDMTLVPEGAIFKVGYFE